MSRTGRYSVIVACLAALVAVLYKVGNAPVKKNVCPHYDDYFNISTNSKCWFDPDVDVNSNVTQILLNNGYDGETHYVTSKDGQILTLFRVVNRNKAKENKGPLFLQHGLTGSSINWVGLGKDSLAFLLSDAGFDVWLGNSRGTIYSRNHTKYTDRDPEFWDHSYHEMAAIDLPEVFKYVRAKCAQQKIVYIGMSMGTTQALVYSSMYPKEALENFKLVILLSPIMTNKHSKGFPYERLGPWMKKIQDLFPAGYYDTTLDFVTGKHNRIMIPFLPMWMHIKIMGPILRLLGLMHVHTMKPETFPKVIHHNPHGASLKTHVHLFAYPKDFRMYDYGKETNLQKYGTELPPKYNLTEIKVPMYMYYSDEDDVSSTDDILALYETIPKEARLGIHKVYNEKGFSHMDFLYGENVRTEVYDHLLDVITKSLKTLH